MHERNPAASRALFWAALALLALSVYGLATRLDAMIGPLRMFVNMAVGEHIPLSRALRYVEWDILLPPLHLLLCAVLSAALLFARRGRRGCAVMLPLLAGALVMGLLLPTSLLGRPARAVTLGLLGLMILLCLLRLVLPRRRAQVPPGAVTDDGKIVPMPPPVERTRPSRHRRIS